MKSSIDGMETYFIPEFLDKDKHEPNAFISVVLFEFIHGSYKIE